MIDFNKWEQIDEDPFAFGERLLAVLADKGMNQSQLADAIGADYSTVSYWMNGRTKPSYQWTKAIALVLDIPTDYLFGLKEAGRETLQVR